MAIHNLAGTIAGSSTLSGTLFRLRNLAGGVVGVASLAGELVIPRGPAEAVASSRASDRRALARPTAESASRARSPDVAP